MINIKRLCANVVNADFFEMVHIQDIYQEEEIIFRNEKNEVQGKLFVAVSALSMKRPGLISIHKSSKV